MKKRENKTLSKINDNEQTRKELEVEQKRQAVRLQHKMENKKLL